MRQVSNYKDAEEQEFSHSMCKDREDKTKIKSNFPYRHILLNIPNKRGFNCASDGV